MIIEDLDLDVAALDNAVTIDHKYGFDVDLIAGYDFGAVRLEAELGYSAPRSMSSSRSPAASSPAARSTAAGPRSSPRCRFTC